MVGWRPAAKTGAIAMVGVVLAVLATGVSQDLVTRRQKACDGTLPMPVSGFWYGWSGAGLAVAALVVAVVQLWCYKRSGLSLAAVVFTVLASGFAVFVLYTLFQDAAPVRSVCFG